jgi:predicted protein tyrosine phosphatase
MNKLKVLFVCTGNIDRSPTAEEIFRSYPGVEAKSAGTSELAPTRISKELVEWADLILVMEERHARSVLLNCPGQRSKIVVLGIEDVYKRGDPALRQIIKQKAEPIILGSLEERAH